jgi:hypothetical protein
MAIRTDAALRPVYNLFESSQGSPGLTNPWPLGIWALVAAKTECLQNEQNPR